MKISGPFILIQKIIRVVHRLVTIRLKTKFSSAKDTTITFINNLLDNFLLWELLFLNRWYLKGLGPWGSRLLLVWERRVNLV